MLYSTTTCLAKGNVPDQTTRGGAADESANTTYSIAHHSHRFAAWAAATAARSSKLCRFDVERGIEILEVIGFNQQLVSPNALPSPDQVDAHHRAWRTDAMAAADNRGLSFTHGIAAKLINVYLKARFVCGGHHDHPRVRCLHPPINAQLLDSLAKNDIPGLPSAWRKAYNWRWSKYDSHQYQTVIDLIRDNFTGRPLWNVEAYSTTTCS